jgi:hypothetical protein
MPSNVGHATRNTVLSGTSRYAADDVRQEGWPVIQIRNLQQTSGDYVEF